MKKLLLIIAAGLLIQTESAAQLKFQKIYGSMDIDYANSFVSTPDGGFCLVGGTGPNMTDSSDVAVYRTDFEGNLIWSTRLSGSKDDWMNDLAPTFDGYVLAGITYSSPLNPTHMDINIIKIDDTGFIYWQKSIGGSNHDEAFRILKANDGGYVIFGATQSFGAVPKSALAFKIDSVGNQEWSYINSSIFSNVYYSADKTPDGGYIAAGTSFNSISGNLDDMFVTKMDSMGIVQWTKYYGTTNADVAFDIKSTRDGGYILVGTSETNTAGSADQCVLRLDGSGNIVWVYNYGMAQYDRANSVIQKSNGNFIVSGYSNIGNPGNVLNQMTLMEIDSLGTLLWSMGYGEVISSNESYKVVQSNNGFAIGGLTIGSSDPLGEAYLIRTDLNGTSGCFEMPMSFTRNSTIMTDGSGSTPTQIFMGEFPLTFNVRNYINQFISNCFTSETEERQVLAGFSIYPNPGRDMISLEIPGGVQNGKIILRDLSGRIVMENFWTEGNSKTLNIGDLAKGMYQLNIKSDRTNRQQTFIKQ